MPQAVALWTELRLPRRRPRAAVFPAALGGGKGLLEAIVLQSEGTTQSCFVCSGLMWQTASAGQMARGHECGAFYLLFGGSKAMHTCWLLFGKTEFVYAYCRYFLSWKMKRKIWVYLQSAHVYLQDLMQIQQQRQGPSSCITISKLRAPLEQRIHKTEE